MDFGEIRSIFTIEENKDRFLAVGIIPSETIEQQDSSGFVGIQSS